MTDVVEAAKQACARGDWAAAFDLLTSDDAIDLAAEDLRRLAEAAWWLGRIDECLDAYAKANKKFRAEGKTADAAMAAFYLALHSSLRGDENQANGWARRCAQLLDETPECAAHGYPLYRAVFAALGSGDAASAQASAAQMQVLGERHGDLNLVAVGLMAAGRTLVKQGRIDEGLQLLDDVLLSVSSGDIDPFWAGCIYCHLMDVCHQLVDVRRAAECTRAAEHWCAPLPDASLYPGICRVHRAQVLVLNGQWDRAEAEAAQAVTDMMRIHPITSAEAHYQIGEIRWLRGDFAGAEESLRHAHEMGVDPQPVLAFIRLAQGRVDLAGASVRASLASGDTDLLGRARLNAALAEIAIAEHDLDTAHAAVTDLEAVAADHRNSGLEATARRARGAVLFAAGGAAAALPVLRSALRLWQELNAPYEVARTRVLLADVYRAIGDEDALTLELDAAALVFDRLGAAPDLARIAERRTDQGSSGGLSNRELEVLRSIAAGHSNRQIATELFLSERTVHRHVSKIFAKLDVASRSAATAFAFEHGIVEGARK